MQNSGAVLQSYLGSRSVVLLPRLVPEKVGFISVFSDTSGVYIKLWRSLFERLAPDVLEELELELGAPIGQGSAHRGVSDAALGLIGRAYIGQGTA